MPLLFHYTSPLGIRGILGDQSIFPGRAVINSSEAVDNYAICLTSDFDPKGHGLPDGREISSAQAQQFNGCISKDGKYFSLDHTKIRIQVRISDMDNNLVYVPELLGKWPDLITSLEVKGYFPCGFEENEPVSSQMGAVYELIKVGIIAGKSSTWWYYQGAIPFHWIVDIAINGGNGQYITGSPEAWLKKYHGVSYG